MRKFNLYLSSRRDRPTEPNIVTGKMGSRDAQTGRYLTRLNNDGIVRTRYIGVSNSKATNYSTEIDKQGWADS